MQLDLIQITSDLHISLHKPVCDRCSDYSCYQYFKYISSKKINSINSRIHSYHQRKNLLRYFLLKCDNLKEVFYDENECIIKLMDHHAQLCWPGFSFRQGFVCKFQTLSFKKLQFHFLRPCPLCQLKVCINNFSLMRMLMH